MKRLVDGEAQTGSSPAKHQDVLKPLPLDIFSLAEEEILAVVSVSSFGDPVLVSENLIAIGHLRPFPKPDNLNLSSIQCEYGILVASCPEGVFVIRETGEQFVIQMPFEPENLILKSETCILTNTKKPFLFCTCRDTALFFSIENENPTNVYSHTVELNTITSAQKNTEDTFIEWVFSSGLRMKIENQHFEIIGTYEAKSTILGVHNNLRVVQRPNHQVIIFKNDILVGLVQLSCPCQSVCFDKFNVYILTCADTPGPVYTKFEHVSMTVQDSIFPSELARSFHIVDKNRIFSTNNFIFFKGAIYFFNFH